MLRCGDGSLYCGITTDLCRRLAEHNGESGVGARYTRSRRPVELVYRECWASRVEAARREAAIKRLHRADKVRLIASGAVVPCGDLR